MRPVLLIGDFGRGDPGTEAVLDAVRCSLEDWPLVVGSSRARRGDEHLASTVARCGTVVVVGADVFTGSRDLVRAALVAAEARLLGRRVAMVGVGADPLAGPLARALARLVARRTDLLVVRDPRSAAALTSAGAPSPVRVGADPAWLTVRALVADPRPGAAHTPASAAPTDEVAVIVDAGADRAQSSLVLALRPLAAEGRPIMIIPWLSGDVDRPEERSAERIATQVGHGARLCPPPADLAEATDRLRQRAVVLTERFYGLHAAAAAGVPAVAVDHDGKTGSLARRLGQPVVTALAPPAAIGAALTNAIGGRPPSAEAMETEIDRAEDAFRLLRLFLDPSRLDDLARLEGLPLDAVNR